MPLNSAGAAFRPWAVLPAKRFARAKTRLGGALPVAARRELARSLCDRVLGACAGCPELAGVLIATDGDDVAALARRRGAAVVRDPEGAALLADVVDAALMELRTRGASHAIVVMADLPRVEARDLRELLAMMRTADVVLAPDVLRRGTSALGVRLALPLRTAFGRSDSLQQHLLEAGRVGVSARLLCNPRLALDVDTPGDLVAARGAG